MRSRYLGADGTEMHWDMIRAVLASVADTAVFPMQDVLGLGSEARMNTPSVAQRQLALAHDRHGISARCRISVKWRSFTAVRPPVT